MADQEDGAGTDEATVHELGRPSLAIAVWTLVSRVTGLGRVVAIAAVLGPTYLGNTFEAANLLPTLTFELFTGAVFRSLLVPPLVQSLDSRRPGVTERLAGSFLGLTLAAFAVVTVIGILVGPLVLWALSSGVADPSIAAAQRRTGWLLLVGLMPQVILYGCGGVGTAVLNARGRFALAAAAPALENVGLIATMGAVALLFGSGVDLEQASGSQIALLALGSTLAVLLHTGAQVFWANRAGVRLVPNLGWRNPAVTAVIRRMLPSFGYAALNVTGVFAVMAVANRVAGGVIAFNFAWYFMYFPVALVARPIGVALLPRLARVAAAGDWGRFRDEVVRTAAVTLFFVVPAGVAYLALARPLAEVVAFGEMATPDGLDLLAVALGALGLGAVGESTFYLATQAHYARGDARSPLMAMIVRTALLVAGTLVATAVEGRSVVVALGLAVSGASLVGSLVMAARLRSVLPATGRRLAPSLGRAVAASAGMVVAARIVLGDGGRWQGPVGDPLGLALAMVAGTVTYAFVQWGLGSPELRVAWTTATRSLSR